MLKALLWKEFKELFAVYKTKKNKSKARSTIGVLLLFLLLYFAMAISFVGIDALFISAISEANLWLYFGLNVVIALILSSLLDVLSTYVSLYKGRDRELMLSLPIKSKSVLLSKVAVVFSFALLNLSYVMLPCCILYATRFSMGIGEVALFILMFLLLGVLVTAITLIVSYLLSFSSNILKSKLFKGLLTMGFLMVLYYFIYFRLNEILENFESNVESIGIGLAKNFKLSTLIGYALSGDVKSIILSIAIIVCLFILVFFIVNKNYIKIISRTASEKNGKVTKNSIKKRGVVGSLFFRELKHFSSSLAYLLNCGLGICIMICGSVVLLIKGSYVSDYMSSFGNNMIFLIVGGVIIISSINGITAPSISLEGKNIWIVKSMPISYMEIFKSKILLHYVLNIVPSIMLLGAMFYVLKADILVCVLAFVAINIYILISAIVGLLENLKHVNLDWVNETVPIKQGVSVILTMLIMWGIAIVVFGLSTLLSIIVNEYIVMGLVILIGGAILTLLYSKLKTKGVARFNEIS